MTSCARLAPAALLVLATMLLGSARASAATDPTGQWPLQPRPEVIAGFDPPESAWGPGHRGVDLAGHPGQPVRAALAGRISFTGTIAGRPVVTVSHGETRTTYEPVATAQPRGTRVAAGAVIGSLGVVGSHCFPRACLHWGWIRDQTYLDPLRLVGGGPVRLMPLAGLPAAMAASSVWARFRQMPTPYADWRPLLRLLRPGAQP